jgi:uncharacterized protein
MKRKRLDRDLWTSIISKRYVQRSLATDNYQGIVALLYLDKVDPPSIWDYASKPVVICETGMKWLQFIPAEENYVLTAMINQENTINTWYIDVIAGTGFSDDGVVYFDDLYLDLIVRPDGDNKVDDLDELEVALVSQDINQELYTLAHKTKEQLANGLLRDIPKLNDFCLRYLEEMEE